LSVHVWPETETLARVAGATFAGAISRVSDPVAVIHSLDLQETGLIVRCTL
jgi:hypothetical protein